MSVVRGFVRNPVAANMLMIILLAGGLVAGVMIPRELFPEFSVDVVSVSVPRPGANPADIEEGIVLKIEEVVAGLDGVKEVSAESREGLGTVLAEIDTDADTQEVLDRIKMEVDRIDAFPADAEEPSTIEVTLRRHVIHVAISGDAPERTLKELAEQVRDEIADLPEVSQVSVSGVREYEISVEVSEEMLRRHSLTLSRVAKAVRDSSFDLPAGTVKTRGGDVALRIVGQRRRAPEFRSIPVLYKPDGTVVRLGDIAVVRESFEDVDIAGQFNGKPAALVSAFKTGDEDTVVIAEAVRRYVARHRDAMPEGIVMETWSDYSKFIRDRLDMLVRNGLMGLAIVFVVLLIFLGVRLSFWVAMGIPVSLLATVLVLHIGDQTLNMMSMFALIMALGLIVDDAIVVGENVYSHVERGGEPHLAAVAGTGEMIAPVTGAVVTTWLAFLPLLLIPGVMGKFIGILPVAVITALAFSLVECLLILPAHLAHSLEKHDRRRDRPAAARAGPLRRFRTRLDEGIQAMIHRGFVPVYRLASRYRYVTVGAVLAVLVAMGGAFAGGRIQTVTFPKVDSDTLQSVLILPTGTPIERTKLVARHITEAARRLNEQFDAPGGEPVVQRVYSLIGQQSGFGGESGSHVAEVIVETLPAEQRGLRSQRMVDRWRANAGRVPDALKLTFGAFRGGPGGLPIEIRLLGPTTDTVKPAAEALKAKLALYPGVRDITDDALPGKLEMKVRLKPDAPTLGIDLRALAVQLRSAFYGNESLKIQRGRDEIKVMVRYPQRQRRTFGDVEEMRVRTASGAEVPFLEVADVDISRGYTTLRRAHRRSVITVRADIDEEIANAEQVLTDLKTGGFLQGLRRRFPRVTVDFRGQRQQSAEALEALLVWFPLALLGIYTVLAAIFRSYTQPAIVMVAIPFGLVGAVIGHWILGFDVTLLSMFGMVALTGIVVNDSLVLIDQVNRRVRDGETLIQAAERGARDRFRPIVLTTATTVGGIAPLLAEQSFQAQFLKPMAVAIAFGLLFATALTLLVVPCLLLIGNDLRRIVAWVLTGRFPAPEDVLPRLHRPDEQPDSS